MKTIAKPFQHTLRPGAFIAAGAKSLVCALASLLLLAGCGDDDTGKQPTLGISPASGTIAFGSNAEEAFRFTVNTDHRDWQAHSDQPWCKVAMDHEAGTFTVTAEPNDETTAPAPATITVTAGKAVPLTISATQAAARYEVYVAGGGGVDDFEACCWKNDRLIPLALPDETKSASCLAICTYDDAVYVGGSYDFGKKSCYWKDGAINFFEQPLEGVTHSECFDITVLDGKVYGAGRATKDKMDFLCCWADNNLYMLDPNPDRDSNCTGIALHDGSIYLSGRFYDNKTATAFYVILNGFLGDPVLLEPLPGYENSHAMNIAVSDGKVYVSGFCYNESEKFIAGYWLDGEFVPLEDPSSGFYATAEAITVVDGKVHIAGTYTTDGTYCGYYWNQEEGYTLLPQPEGSIDEMLKRDIAVFGDKVFVSGNYSLGNVLRACYWINRERVDLYTPDGGDTYSASMTVIKR